MRGRVSYPRWLKASLAALIVSVVGLNVILPPPVDKIKDVSSVVTDKNGLWLAGFTIDDGIWRIPVKLGDVDPRFTERLIAIEDSRFWQHSGVDVLAIGRAARSWVRAGEPLSGASTITMQLVRQLEPRPRTLKSKVIESFRAVQLELWLSKTEILEAYLTHTPYGGNIEGIQAASLTYFDKTPDQLTDSEIALLIAIPQAPEARRPDRRLAGATSGRDKILTKLTENGSLNIRLVDEAKSVAIKKGRQAVPELAWITAYGLAQEDERTQSHIDRHLQAKIETVTARFIEPLDRPVNTAVTIVDNRTMQVRVHIASADRKRPGGWIDMTDRARSPGSTLKPFIYGLAIDDGIASAGSFVHDAPTRFGTYQPENFNRRYHGDVRIYEALRHSLNVPAVAILDRIGGQRFESTLEQAGVNIQRLGRGGEDAGLALALGGAGLSVNDLAVLYAALANGGMAQPLKWTDEFEGKSNRLLSEQSASDITKILRQAPTPSGRVPGWLAENAPPIAYKTGTSYGFRDAWAAGYTDDWTIVVWVGRPDGAPRRGETGRLAAAPLLFDLFAQLPHSGSDTVFTKDADAPSGLSRIAEANDKAPQILFPPDGTELLAPTLGPDARGFSFSARSSEGDVTFYVGNERLESKIWRPDEAGFYTVTAVDGQGRSSHSQVQVLTLEQMANAGL